MKKARHKLTLYQPATYAIKVPGEIDQEWSEMIVGITVTVEKAEDYLPVTILTCTVDQAALHGLLRQLYGLGMPLISVQWLTSVSED